MATLNIKTLYYEGVRESDESWHRRYSMQAQQLCSHRPAIIALQEVVFRLEPRFWSSAKEITHGEVLAFYLEQLRQWCGVRYKVATAIGGTTPVANVHISSGLATLYDPNVVGFVPYNHPSATSECRDYTTSVQYQGPVRVEETWNNCFKKNREIVSANLFQFPRGSAKYLPFYNAHTSGVDVITSLYEFVASRQPQRSYVPVIVGDTNLWHAEDDKQVTCAKWKWQYVTPNSGGDRIMVGSPCGFVHGAHLQWAEEFRCGCWCDGRDGDFTAFFRELATKDDPCCNMSDHRGAVADLVMTEQHEGCRRSMSNLTSPYVSEEQGSPLARCPGDAVANGVKCRGANCDDMALICHWPSEFLLGGYTSSGHWFSEESRGIWRDVSDRGVVTGLKCRGRYCDDVQLQYTTSDRFRQEPASCDWSDWVSEEDGARYCRRNYYVAGMKCRGDYCDDVSLWCCRFTLR